MIVRVDARPPVPCPADTRRRLNLNAVLVVTEWYSSHLKSLTAFHPAGIKGIEISSTLEIAAGRRTRRLYPTSVRCHNRLMLAE